MYYPLIVMAASLKTSMFNYKTTYILAPIELLKFNILIITSSMIPSPITQKCPSIDAISTENQLGKYLIQYSRANPSLAIPSPKVQGKLPSPKQLSSAANSDLSSPTPQTPHNPSLIKYSALETGDKFQRKFNNPKDIFRFYKVS